MNVHRDVLMGIDCALTITFATRTTDKLDLTAWSQMWISRATRQQLL